MSLLCETVAGRTMAELVAARDAADAADMVELRLDYVDRADVGQALAGRRKPVVVTVRAKWEGGRFEGAEEERKRLLREALERGADYVDLEWRAGFDDLVRDFGSRVVLSAHDFAGVPADLAGQARAMRQTGAAVIKVAVTPARLTDTLPLREVASAGDAVVLGMGDAGLPSRLLASRFGSRWTYGGNAVAPGQIPARRMLHEFCFRDIGPATAIYGVVGTNAAHSLSPAMHNAAFRAAGIDAVYVPLRAASIEDFFAFADALGIQGASVTVPYKVDAIEWPSVRVNEATRAIGAANTLRRVAGGWEATNTDVAGFLEPLEATLAAGVEGLAGALGPATRVAVLGAGGAARAVVTGLVSRGASVTVYARRPEQAQALAGIFGVKACAMPPAPGSWDVLVNCTPLGGASDRDASPLPGGPFDGRLVYDLTYGPGESRLLREARAAGCAVIDGLPMLAAQAERQFEWWTGRRPATGLMMRAAGAAAGITPVAQGSAKRQWSPSDAAS